MRSIEAAGHYMAAEIAEQPAVLARLFADGGAELAQVRAALADRRPRFVLLAARGSSDHAALYAKYLVEVRLRLPAGLVSPSAMTVYGARPELRDVLFLAISQSGGSPDLLESLVAARDCGALTVAVTNNPASELARAAEYQLDLHAGPERAVAATKSYTAELLALYLLLAPLAGAGLDRPELAEQVRLLAAAAEQTLAAADPAVTAAAQRYLAADRLITTGRGFGYPTAREAALKLMETCYLSAQAFSGADLLHGPMAMVETGLPLIAIHTPGAGGRAMLAVLERLRERQADLLLVGDPAGDLDSAAQPADQYLPVITAGLPEELYPIVEILPLQQLACRLAVLRGGDPDAPRGLAKVTRTW
ncbi:MAG TPA: SIS domain-containing protein [Jatrophihabitans sp.]|nr:SIS domain-containing protein [Jatrophihabitans sp.]